MKNYYTPTPEEFHVGFEYEIKGVKEIWQSAVWQFHNFSEGRFLANLTYAESIRIKYLDQEDIENEGWEFIGKSIDKWYEKTGDFDMGSWTSRRIVLHYGEHDHRLHILAIDPPDETTRFNGVIKNISEFRMLQKQLGIK